MVVCFIGKPVKHTIICFKTRLGGLVMACRGIYLSYGETYGYGETLAHEKEMAVGFFHTVAIETNTPLHPPGAPGSRGIWSGGHSRPENLLGRF
jgi:hypothetical protein